ncbi:P-loop containing nucleoside triphosphate hydrolase protein, partial [Pavlovales sp. CCMP2436]
MKLVCLGDEGVGKRTLLRVLCVEGGAADAPPSVQVGAYAGQLTLELGAEHSCLEAWLGGGGEDSTRLRAFYRTADVVVLAYDTTSLASFASVRDRLLPELLPVLPPSCHGLVLVGLRADLVALREVGYEMLDKLATRHVLPFLEVSVQDGSNV